MSYNAKQKLIDNIAALKVIASRGGYSPHSEEEEKVILSKWSGVGGIKGVLHNWYATKEKWEEDGASKQDLELYDLYKEFFEAIKDIFPFAEHKRVVASVKNGVLSQFFTPNVVPRTFYEVLSQYMDVKKFYEPSAGSGVFVTEAVEVFPGMDRICAYEKDLVTARVLGMVIDGCYGQEGLYGGNKGFEESPESEKEKYDLLATNPPYGDFAVYDPVYSKDKTLNDFCKKIHNYFVAKSIEKVRDGGVIAMLITDAFLNTVSNKSIRRYLFERCDFVSLTVMPDNLMQDTGGTMAPSHFIVVQKNSTKKELSPEEELLVESSFVEGATGKYAMNNWLQENPGNVIFTEMKNGTNQYGKAGLNVIWKNPIEEIAKPFKEILERDIYERFTLKWEQARIQEEEETKNQTVQHDFDNFAERMEEMFKPRSEWEFSELVTDEDDKEYENQAHAAWAEQEIKDDDALLEEFCNKYPIIAAPVNTMTMGIEIPEINIVLPEYVPFKNGIIVEI